MPILNQRDYRLAKARVVQLEAARGAGGIIESTKNLAYDVAQLHRGTLDSERARLLTEIEEYERLRGSPTSTEAIEGADLGLLPIIARITRGLSQRQLAELLGIAEQQVQRYERERYSAISLSRYEKILGALGVQLDARLGSAPTSRLPEQVSLKFSPAVVKEAVRRRWLGADIAGSEEQAALQSYVFEGAHLGKSRVLHRRSAPNNRPYDDSALVLWRARILKLGHSRATKCRASFNIADLSWLRELTALSERDEGPLNAVSYLEEKGIIVVIESHLDQTYLDGAAMVLTNGVPIVGLTLRHDRIDSFWFTLLHEIGHVFLHFNRGLSEGFVDDWDNFDENDSVEREANNFATSTLIPDELWKFAPVRFSRSVESIQNFAASNKIHPAIVAGRIRQERGDYTKFGKLLGQGQVRRLFQ